jgi:hypothetical protein
MDRERVKMKIAKNTIVICIAVFALSFAYSLKVDAQELELGLRFNPEFSTLTNQNDANAGGALGFTSHFSYLSFGAGATYNINRNLGLAVDLLFSREGQAFEGQFNGGVPVASTNSSVVSTQLRQNNMVIVGGYVALAELNYVKLPVMLSITSDNTRPFFFTMLIGPQLNFLEGVAQEVNGSDLDYPNSNIAPGDLYKSITVNAVLAVGGAYNISPNMVLSARVRFDYGFNDVEKKDVLVSYSGAAPVRFYSGQRQSTHNATGALMIGLDFKL